MKSTTCRTYLPHGSINWSTASLLSCPASIAVSCLIFLLSRASNTALKLGHAELPLFLFLDFGAGPEVKDGEGGMVEGWVGTEVEAESIVVGVGWAESIELSRSVILMVENWELMLTWDEV